MIAIVCVDQNNGMMFHNRRQSMDREIRKDIQKLIGNKRIWMSEYSFGQFEKESMNISVDVDFWNKASRGEYCFFEDIKPEKCNLEEIILYRWDKKYPADIFFDMCMEGWKLESTLEIKGYSHEIITREVYRLA